MASSSQAGNNRYLEVVERDSSERYVRYNKIIGKGAAKKVYLGFDVVNGTEIAWSITKLTEKTLKDKKVLENYCAEAHLLKSLEHDNVMRCYDSWIDEHNKIIHMITEYFTSGNLIHYLRIHKHADMKTVKNCARQILRGLDYLHSHRQPIVHRDIKCGNIFVNGNTGGVKLGDFGFAFILELESNNQKMGTPQFLAPEIVHGSYNQLVDIYSFGMSMLEMVTREAPYSECSTKHQILAKIMSGEMPVALSKVTDPEVKEFIKKCLVPASERPAATDLLNDPFLEPSISETLTARSIMSLREAVANDVARLLEKKFKLQGRTKDNVSISMTFWITFGRKVEKIEFFEFLLETDKTPVVMQKLATDNGLSTGEVRLVSELMEELITALKSSDRPWQTLEISR